MYEEFARAEIIDWWDQTRDLVVSRCHDKKENLLDLVDQHTHDVSTTDLINPWSSICAEIQAEIEREIHDFSSDLAHKLELSLEKSLARIENSPYFKGFDPVGVGILAASGAAGAGSIGLAVAATGLATTTLPAWVFLSTTAFSWPVFAAVGAGAITAGLVSRTVANKGYGFLLERYRKHLKSLVEAALVAEVETNGRMSCKTQMLSQLDAIRDARLKGLIS